ncbi:hypothetical protein ACSBR2_003061 [Camellia fascicularis]
MFALLKVLLSTLYQLWGNVLHFVLRPFSSLIIHNQRTSGGKMSQWFIANYPNLKIIYKLILMHSYKRTTVASQPHTDISRVAICFLWNAGV